MCPSMHGGLSLLTDAQPVRIRLELIQGRAFKNGEPMEKRPSQGPSFLLEHWTHPYREEGNLNDIQQTYTSLDG